MEVLIERHHEKKSLQAADFISWAILKVINLLNSSILTVKDIKKYFGRRLKEIYLIICPHCTRFSGKI